MTDRFYIQWSKTEGREYCVMDDAAGHSDKTSNDRCIAIEAHIHLIRVFCDDMTERNWDDKRMYIKQQAGRITAALSAAPEAVRVKELEWVGDAIGVYRRETAKSSVGAYSIWEGENIYLNGDRLMMSSDREAAKAAAQSDYEDRILSALATTEGK